VVAIDGGLHHSLALRSDGTVVAWGEAGPQETPPADLAGVTAISAGGLHNLALVGPAGPEPYEWSGLGWPVRPDGSSAFRAGSVVPVRFSLTGASAGVTDAPATLSYAPVADGVVGTPVEATSRLWWRHL